MLWQSFHPTRTESAPRERIPAATAVSSQPIATILQVIDAWREALSAHRQYERLTSRGVAHDPALQEALRIPADEVGAAGLQAARCRSKPHTGDRMRGEAQIGNLTFVQ
jgi:ABC-type protease/lipase transport system fused ATPase/permease subunit